MKPLERNDDFGTRRKHLQSLSDEELHQLVDELLAWSAALAPLRTAPPAAA